MTCHRVKRLTHLEQRSSVASNVAAAFCKRDITINLQDCFGRPTRTLGLGVRVARIGGYTVLDCPLQSIAWIAAAA